jgi:hypothetical protein
MTLDLIQDAIQRMEVRLEDELRSHPSPGHIAKLYDDRKALFNLAHDVCDGPDEWDAIVSAPASARRSAHDAAMAVIWH